MKSFYLTSLLIAFSSSILFASSKVTYGDALVEQVVAVIDGDTLKVNLRNMPAIIGQQINVRVFGVDTPELKSKDPAVRERAIRAKNYVSQKVSRANRVELKNMRRDKYFRILADVLLDGKDLASDLIAQGHAQAYFGETKPDWSEAITD